MVLTFLEHRKQEITSLKMYTQGIMVSKCFFFYGAAYQKSQTAVFMLPEKGVPSAVVRTVRRSCQHYAAGLEGISTGEVPRLQKFCRHSC